ncbi:hypothetical protein ACFQU2_05620 [Siccirubricoccus deserti]
MDLIGIGALEHALLEVVPQSRPDLGPATAAGISAHAFTYPERVPDPVAREAMFARHWTQLQSSAGSCWRIWRRRRRSRCTPAMAAPP